MKKITVTDILLLLLSLALCIGIKVFFHACGPKEDGSFMACHWAEQAVFAASIGMAGVSCIRLLLDRREKAGAALAVAVMAAVTAFLPGVFIRLCMMKEMRCHAVMRPAVLLLCIAVAAAGVTDFVLSRKDDRHDA